MLALRARSVDETLEGGAGCIEGLADHQIDAPVGAPLLDHGERLRHLLELEDLFHEAAEADAFGGRHRARVTQGFEELAQDLADLEDHFCRVVEPVLVVRLVLGAHRLAANPEDHFVERTELPPLEVGKVFDHLLGQHKIG